ncbi:MAG: hypothetical protein R3D53_12985 [Paracoccaceae bacterium]
MKAIAMVSGLSLVHPAIAYGAGRWVFDLDTALLRSAVLTAAMAPGVNAYLLPIYIACVASRPQAPRSWQRQVPSFDDPVWIAILP